MSHAEKTADRLWGIANAIAAFSIAQFITLFFSMASSDFRAALSYVPVKPIVIGVIAGITVAQLVLIRWCDRCLARLESDPDPTAAGVERQVAAGRSIIVLLFATLSILALFMPELVALASG